MTATRIVFAGGQEVTVSQPEDDVVLAIRRDHPNPVRLERPDGRPLHVNWDHVAMIEQDA
jgi:hypothetical protein